MSLLQSITKVFKRAPVSAIGALQGDLAGLVRMLGETGKRVEVLPSGYAAEAGDLSWLARTPCMLFSGEVVENILDHFAARAELAAVTQERRRVFYLPRTAEEVLRELEDALKLEQAAARTFLVRSMRVDFSVDEQALGSVDKVEVHVGSTLSGNKDRVVATSTPRTLLEQVSKALQGEDPRASVARLGLLMLKPADLRAVVESQAPAETLPAKERAERLRALDERETAANDRLRELAAAPGRRTPEGFDCWLAQLYAACWLNAHASEPCDHAGRKLETKDQAAALAKLQIRHGLVDGKLFIPTNESRMHLIQ